MKIIKVGQEYKLTEDNCSISTKLEPNIYILDFNSMTGEFFLIKQMFSKFKLPSKLYGNANEITDRIIKTYYRKNQKMGVLLHGEKGTGKSIISKQIVNRLSNTIPVIIIKDFFKDSTALENFLNELNTPIIVFIDEFEKIYYNIEHQNTMLSIMDGTGQSDILFLLTSNGETLNNYLINRPGRIYYSIKFDGLDESTINSVIDDILVNPQYKDLIHRMCTIIGVINFDMLVAIIDEVNNNSLTDLNDLFYYLNIEPARETYQILIESKHYKGAGFILEGRQENPLMKGFKYSDYFEDITNNKHQDYQDSKGESIYANISIMPHEIDNLKITKESISFENEDYVIIFKKQQIRKLIF